MRKPNVFRHESALPRMSWSPRNLYNLIARSSTPMLVNETSFQKTSMTMYQQRWRSKRLLRAYHGDWIPERRFKRWFLPTTIPSFSPPLNRAGPLSKGSDVLDTPTPPVKNLFVRDVERRIDTVVFRCCFAHSVYYARSLVLHGKVRINGLVSTDPGRLLDEGDLITVEPDCVPMLNKEVAKRVQTDRERLAPPPPAREEPETNAETAEAAPAAEDAPAQETEGGEAPAAEDAATTEEPASENKTKPANSELAPGVLPFHLPPFAAPFLFIPPYLDVSFRTCSAIYLHHPTLSQHVVRSRDNDSSGGRRYSQLLYRSDIPSPYPAHGDIFGLAWELYARNAPRVRADERRTKLLGRVGRNGFDAARAFEQDRRRVATRRGWGRTRPITRKLSPFARASRTKTSP
ncbi:hypothetical protein MCAP1_002985 [Malassezia caprae]|uniref:RNA-binding S4 domain-containing protein n=1 Tax=Malassezia caprae TaxID=1381934 RepID=A0AAF0EAL0_9BASI|nr:hypothetical protein MCAP1_002985 [Malassezia caprae]